MSLEDVFHCLCKWIALLTKCPNAISIGSLVTGHAFADVLNVIDPSYFDEKWRQSIKDVVREDSSYSGVKMVALRKVLKALLTYSRNVCGQPISASITPDITKIAKDSTLSELVKFMQLIVASAVHGPKGEEMIGAILTMEESIQQTIMLSIKELENCSKSYSSAAGEHEETAILEKLGDNMLSDESTVLHYAQLESQLSECINEKQALENEVSVLKTQLETCTSSLLETQKETGSRIHQLVSNQEALQLELEKSENSRDALSAEVEKLQKELWSWQIRGSNEAEDQTRRTKDEMDELRAKAMEAEKLSQLVEQLRKKLENMADMKTQMKVLEEQNASLMAQSIQSEEEQRKSLSRKAKLEALQTKLQQMECRSNEDASKVVHLEMELRRTSEREAIAVEERDRLRQERSSLQDTVADLQCRLAEMTNGSQHVPSAADCAGADLDTMMALVADAPVEIKQKLLQLYQENRLLKARLLVADSKFGSEVDLRSHGDPEAASQCQLSAYKSQVDSLKRELAEKTAELEKTVRDKRESLEKARQIILALNPVVKSAGDAAYTVCDIEAIKASLAEKEAIIEEMQEEMDRMKIMYEQEQRLITTAFHELAWQMHRRAGEERMAVVLGEEPQTFLSQQRQVSMTKLRGSNDANVKLR